MAFSMSQRLIYFFFEVLIEMSFSILFSSNSILVTDPEHVELFLEIYHNNLNKEGTARERALLIHQLWRDKALELRDLD